MRKNLKACGQAVTGDATGVTLYSYYNSMRDNSLRKEMDDARLRAIEANERVNDLEKDSLLNQVPDARLDAIKAKFEVYKEKIDINYKDITELQDNANSKIEYEQYVRQLKNDTENSTNLIDKAIEILIEKKSKFWEGSDDWIKTIHDFYNQYTSFLDDLTLQQLASLSHLLAALFILICLFSIIVIIYSDFLLNYLKIEDKYPKLGKIIRYRKKFQQFYLFINLLLIIVTLFAIIFINYIALIQ